MNNYCVVICHKETDEEVKLLGEKLSKHQANKLAEAHEINLNHSKYYIEVLEWEEYKMIEITLDEFVEVCVCNGYKSMSIDFSNGSVSVLIGDKRVEATELGYEVKV